MQLHSKEYYRAITYSTILFMVGWTANTFAILYATEKASNPVTDIILSNIPAYDVDGLFVYGTVVVALITVIFCAMKPQRFPFILYGIGVFWIIRSLFTVLTHIAPFDLRVGTEFGPHVQNMFFGADRFFSAHTGLPFLGALVAWREPHIRYFFLAASAFFAIIVLLGHLHYSIDVLSAFFITYAIFDIVVWMFPKERALFLSK